MMDQFTTRLRSARDALIPRLLSAPLPVAEDGPLRSAGGRRQSSFPRPSVTLVPERSGTSVTDGRGKSRYPLRRTDPSGIRDRRIEGTADPLQVSRMVTVPLLVRVPSSGLTAPQRCTQPWRLGEHAFKRERMSLGNEAAR